MCDRNAYTICSLSAYLINWLFYLYQQGHRNSEALYDRLNTFTLPLSVLDKVVFLTCSFYTKTLRMCVRTLFPVRLAGLSEVMIKQNTEQQTGAYCLFAFH